MRKIRIAQIGTNRYSHAPEVFISLKSMTDIFDVVAGTLIEYVSLANWWFQPLTHPS